MGLFLNGCIFLSHKRPATDKAMNKYSAKTPMLINTIGSRTSNIITKVAKLFAFLI